MNDAIETTLGPRAYLDSLVMDTTEPWSQVYTLDGATLHRITDDHYVVMECAAHDGHQGHQLVTNVLPREWECFHSAINVDAEFEVHHYGPAWE